MSRQVGRSALPLAGCGARGRELWEGLHRPSGPRPPPLRGGPPSPCRGGISCTSADAVRPPAGNCIKGPPSPACIDRGHGGQVFGDIVDTFDSESWRLSDAVQRGFPNGHEAGVCDAGVGGGIEHSRAVPALRDQPDDRLQVAGALARSGPVWSCGGLAPAARLAGAQQLQRSSGGAFGSRGASGLGRSQDRPAAQGSRPRRGAGGLDGDGDPQAARGRARRLRRRRLRFTRFERARPNELWQMDFKGHVALAGTGRLHPLTVLDDHSRFAVVLGRLRRRADGDGQAAPDRGLPPLRLARDADHRQRLALGRRAGQPFTPLGVWLLEQDIADRPFASLPSPDHGQGRALPPQPQGRGPVRAAVRRSRRRRAGASAAGGMSTITNDRTRHSIWRCRPAAIRRAGATTASSRRRSSMVPATSSVRSRRAAGSVSCRASSGCRKPSAARRWPSGQPRATASTKPSSGRNQSQPSTFEPLDIATQKVSTMSPNTCPPCPRPEQERGGGTVRRTVGGDAGRRCTAGRE